MQIIVSPDAAQDVDDIYVFLSDREGFELAEKTQDRLESAFASLDKHPARGHRPPEISGLGMNEIFEIHVKPYRIIYQVKPKEVWILFVADSRRDLKDLFAQRLMR